MSIGVLFRISPTLSDPLASSPGLALTVPTAMVFLLNSSHGSLSQDAAVTTNTTSSSACRQQGCPDGVSTSMRTPLSSPLP